MDSSQALEFANPPVWEVGLAMVIDGPQLYDPYDVRSVHENFQDRFPEVERQTPLVGLEPFKAVSPAAFQPIIPFRLSTQQLEPQRWWFKSSDGQNLIQLQEDIVARNWRRSEPAPSPLPAYPGFGELLRDLKDIVAKLDEWHRSRSSSLGAPTVCDLLYDNFIPMRNLDGTVHKLRDIFPGFGIKGDITVSNMAVNWFENIINLEKDTQDFRVTAINVSPSPPSIMAGEPYVKLTLNARSAISSWEEAWNFFEIAHRHTRNRLIELTGSESRAAWG